MTIRDLSQYHNIKVEIDQIKLNIKELEATVIGSSKITGIPTSHNNTTSSTERIGIKLAQLKTKLSDKTEELLDEAKKVEDFLETVEDADIRIIIRERFLNGKTWNEVSQKIIADRSTPYYRIKRYLRERSKDEEKKEKKVLI